MRTYLVLESSQTLCKEAMLTIEKKNKKKKREKKEFFARTCSHNFHDLLSERQAVDFLDGSVFLEGHHLTRVGRARSEDLEVLLGRHGEVQLPAGVANQLSKNLCCFWSRSVASDERSQHRRLLLLLG